MNGEQFNMLHIGILWFSEKYFQLSKNTWENAAFRNISLESHVLKGLRSHEAKFNIHQTLVHRMLFTDNALSHLHLQNCCGNAVDHLVFIFHWTIEFLYFDLYSFILKLRSR